MPMNTRTSGTAPTADDPYVGAVAIDYSGGNQVLATHSRGIYVGVGGALAVTFIDGSTATLTGLVAGTVYRLCVKQINQTGSTATGCFALL